MNSLVASLKRLVPRKGSFSSHVLTLMTGSTIAQAIPILISPILTRIYAPGDFGLFALYMSVGSVAVIATARYELAVMLPAEDAAAYNILALSTAIAFFISLIALLAILVFNKPISRALGNVDIAPWLYFIPLTILITGIYKTLNYWFNRKQRYFRLALSRISQAVATGVSNLSMALLKTGPAGLILGGVVGQSVAVGILGIQLWDKDKDKIKSLSYGVMAEQAKIYSNFPKINTFHSLTDIIMTSGSVFVISMYFPASILGFFYMTKRVLLLPSNMVGNAISQAFYQKASHTYNHTKDLGPLFKKTLPRLFGIALPGFLITVFFAPFLFSLIFGSQWREAGRYAQIIAPYILLQFVASPLSLIPLILNEQKMALAVSLTGNLIGLLSIFVGGYFFHDLVKGLYLMSFLLSIYFIFYFFWIYHIISKAKEISQ